MKRTVSHKSIIRPGNIGGTVTTTLCGRMDNSNKDGYNVSDEVTCKHCLNAMNKAWGKRIISISENYVLSKEYVK